MTTRALIFDCDGVLVESAEETLAHIEAVLVEVGRDPLTSAEADAALSLSGPALLDHLFRGDEARRVRAYAVAQSIPLDRYAHLIRATEGVHALMSDLGARFRLGVASNRGASLAAVLRHVGLVDHFHATVGAHEVGRPKPHPDVLLLCLERLGVRARDAVYVGDTTSDLEAARAAGVAFVGFGSRVAHEFRIDALTDLPSALDGIR